MTDHLLESYNDRLCKGGDMEGMGGRERGGLLGQLVMLVKGKAADWGLGSLTKEPYKYFLEKILFKYSFPVIFISWYYLLDILQGRGYCFLNRYMLHIYYKIQDCDFGDYVSVMKQLMKLSRIYFCDWMVTYWREYPFISVVIMTLWPSLCYKWKLISCFVSCLIAGTGLFSWCYLFL